MEKNRIATRVMFVIFLIILGLAYLAWLPREMQNFDGYEAEAMPPSEVNRYAFTISQKLKDGKTIKINERDLNRYLKGKLSQEQSLAIKPWIIPTGIFTDLTTDHINICLERNINERFLHQTELSIELKTEIEQTNTQYTRNVRISTHGGKVGRLKLPKIFAGGWNAWYPPFADLVTDELLKLGLEKYNYQVVNGEIIISP